MSEQYEMQDDWKRAEAESWKRWKSPETWGNTDSGAHTHGFKAGFEYAQARAEAAEQQAARLREALQAAKAFDDHRLHCRDDICWKRAGLWQAQRKMAVEALAASQPAPAAEFTAQELDDIISGTLTVPRSVVERAMRQRGGQAEGEG